METMNVASPKTGGKPGCLPAAAAWTALVVLAPIVALVQWWRRFRRGGEARVRRRINGGQPLAVVDLTVDVPASSAGRARRELVDALVRLAEHLRRPDDLYHLVWRPAGESEPRLVAVSPAPQGLAQRLDTALSHRSYERRTQLWLTLPVGAHLAGLLDPLSFDPEHEGAAAVLIERTGPRWALELSFARGTPAVLYRLRLHVPDGEIATVEAILSRYERRLAAPTG